jgi:ectoine hydroxylase-related dioxygenase (phytanoyl-CoA dioxygenase family)
MRTAIEHILSDVEGTADDANHRWSAAEKETVLKGFHNVQYHDAAFTRAASHPRMVEVLTQLIGPNVQLHHTKMLVKPPEKGAPFPMHQDYPYFPHERHTVLAASIHLDDTDEENGCLHVVPASHKLGPLEPTGDSNDLDTPLEDGTPIPAGAGDVLFFQLPDHPRLGRERELAHPP